MTWTHPEELRTQLVRLWERGEILRDVITGNVRFPLRLTFKGPSSTEITNQLEAVRNWVARLMQTRSLHLEWQTIRHRVQGEQNLPACIRVDSLEEALLWIGKRSEWQRFSTLVELTRQECPPILPWLEKRPLQALALTDAWPRLLAVIAWLKNHPQPAIYVRQVDIPGIHSKFIEAHRAVLIELLDLALPASSVDGAQTGVARFALRYGFLDKPARIRLRVLDPGMEIITGIFSPDVTLDAASFSRLQLEAKRVLVTENEINFLALPHLPETMAIFGSGYGWEALARARWLEQCNIHYWGDIDTHGFAILDQLRGYFSHTQSLLMDSATLEAHTLFWGQEDKPFTADLHRLTAEEQHLYNDLRNNRFRAGLRLEQEHLGFGWVSTYLDRLL